MSPGLGSDPIDGQVAWPSRRFALADGMILVLGLAIGFAMIHHEEYRFPTSWLKLDVVYGSGICLGLSLAHLPIRLRKPRPPWRSLAPRPGTSASLIAVAMLAVDTAFILASALRMPRRINQIFPLDDLVALIGSAILGVWIVQVAAGSLDRRGDWVEWAGRVLGLCWILLLVAFLWDLYS